MLAPQLKTAQTLISNVSHEPTTNQAWEKTVPPASLGCKGLSHRTEVLAKCLLLAAILKARQSVFRSFTPSKVLHNSLLKCNCTKAVHAGLWAFIMHYYKFVSTRQNLPFCFSTAKIWHFQTAVGALFVIPQYHELKPRLLEEQGKNRKQGIFC